MRNCSIGAVLCILLLITNMLWGPFSRPAVADPGIVFGMVVDGNGLVASSEQGEQLGRYLESQLAIPVKVRSFTAVEQLYRWVTRFGEVDIAWFSNDFMAKVPAGQLIPLVLTRTTGSGRTEGQIVANPAVSSALQQRLGEVLMSLHEAETGRELLAGLGLSPFFSPTFEQTHEWEVATSQQTAGADVQKPVGGPGQPSDKAVVAVAPVTVVPSAIESQRAVPMSPDPGLLTDQSPPSAPALIASELTSTAVQEDTESAAVAPVEQNLEQTPPTAADQVALVADSLAYNAADDSYEAKGDVVLRRSDVEMRSERLLWQSSTQDAAAEGDVQLNDASATVSGDSIQYNMSTGQGQVHDGRVLVKEGNFHIVGDEIEKRGQADYFVRNGSFTTCDGEIPDWKFSAREVDVTLGGYARAKSVFFHVKDIPVFYMPYLAFPVKTERESGFLTPSFGYSSSKGLLASLAWYQVIDRHMDATVYLDYMSDVALGKGLEYRYALANQNNGRALYYHVTGTDDDPETNYPDSYYLEWQHTGNLPGGWRLSADVEHASKKEFFEEFGDVAEDYNRDKTVSTVTLNRNWEKLNLVGYARYIDDLETDNDDTLQRLPELSLGQSRYRLGDTPLYLGLESYATRFTRDQGDDGERLYLRPYLSAAFTPGSWLEISPEVALHERLYHADAADDEQFLPDFSLTLATRLAKVFAADLWGSDALMHTVEPKLIYRYVPDENQDDLPLFDLYDRLGARNDMTFALVNRLTARTTAEDGSKSYRELLNLRLSQSYDLDEARNNTSGKDQPFSDVRVELDLWPTRYIALDVTSLIPVYGDDGLWTLAVGGSVRDDSGNAIRANYSYKDKELLGSGSEYFSWKADTALFKPVYVSYLERHDLVESRALERSLGLEFRAKCWSLFLSYQQRYRANDDDERSIMFNIVLSGLGENQGFMMN